MLWISSEEARITNETPGVTREMILATLTRDLKPLDFAHALWEGGAIGYGRLDEWSDIDAYLLVDDGRIDDAFAAVEQSLRSLSPIAIKYEIGKTPWPGVHQAFYRLERSSEFLIIDMAILAESAPDKFLEPELHGTPTFYFDKSGGITLPSLDKAELSKKVGKRTARLEARVKMFHVFVQKELNRGQLMEALDAYRLIVLDSLTELLRIRHHPVHHEFRTRYLYHELPREVAQRLEDLHLIAGKDDLEKKYGDAMSWFFELLDEVHVARADAPTESTDR